MKYYHPYKSDKPEKKYFIMTKTGKHIYIGQASASDITHHKMKTEKIGIFYVIRKMKIGVNLE